MGLGHVDEGADAGAAYSWWECMKTSSRKSGENQLSLLLGM